MKVLRPLLAFGMLIAALLAFSAQQQGSGALVAQGAYLGAAHPDHRSPRHDEKRSKQTRTGRRRGRPWAAGRKPSVLTRFC